MKEAGALPASQWAYRSAGELVQSLREKQISALELTDQFIARIEALDGDINAVVVRDFDHARDAAKAADAALARGVHLPLLGVPVTIKESYNTARLPTTWGIPAFKDFIAEQDALAVTRFKAAGAIVLGKTNVPLGLGDWQSYNDIYGTTNNPWDKTRSPGGSSGGSSAALAAGFGPLSLGTDIGGSLRVPAHFCGICAHKPTYGLAPTRGHLPPGLPDWSAPRDLMVIGPMACHVDDLALALHVIAGPDETTNGQAYHLTLPPARHKKLTDFRVLYVDEHPFLPSGASMLNALDGLVESLTKAGVVVERQSPLLPDLAASARLFGRLLNSVLSAGFPDDVFREVQSAAINLDPADQSLSAELLRGAVLTHREWLRADSARQALRQQWRALFHEFDVVLCPTAATPAFPHDHSPSQAARSVVVDGREFPYLNQLVWAELATTCGLPATIVPIGLADGLPLTVQIIGAEFEDLTTLAFARFIEQELGGFKPPPSYA
jgi:amidase